MISITANKYKPDFELDKLLWRYRQGWYDESRLMKELGNILDHLADCSFRLYLDIDLIRQFRQEELILLDKRRGEIAHLILQHEFAEAVWKIRQAYEILNELQETAIAAQMYRSTTKNIEELQRLTDNGLFSNTPTFRIILQLQNITREYLERRQTQKARLSLLVCLGEINHLLGTQEEFTQFIKLEKRVEEIDHILEKIHHIKSLGANNETYYRKVKQLKEITKSHHLLLASRLLAEFEVELSDKLLFYSEIIKAPEQLKSSVIDTNLSSIEIKKNKTAIVDKWDETAAYLLEQRIKANISHLETVAEKIHAWFASNKEEK